MNNIPTRNKDSILAEIILKKAMKPNAYYILTEDENIVYAYNTIITKVAPELEIGKIFGMGGKTNVMTTFRNWKRMEKTLDKCFFIVDKDFDFWEPNFIPEVHENLLELPCYTVENLFYNMDSARIIMNIYKNKTSRNEAGKVEELEKKYFTNEFWEVWQNNFSHELSKIFMYFVIVIKNNLSISNCGDEPMKYILYDHKKNILRVKHEVIDSYKEKVITEIGEEKFQSDLELIKDYYSINGCIDYPSLIKGKYLLFGLLSQIRLLLNNTGIYYKEIDNSLLISLIYELPVEYFSCFNKIKTI